jgi:hypothetical protein
MRLTLDLVIRFKRCREYKKGNYVRGVYNVCQITRMYSGNGAYMRRAKFSRLHGKIYCIDSLMTSSQLVSSCDHLRPDTPLGKVIPNGAGSYRCPLDQSVCATSLGISGVFLLETIYSD